VMLVTDLLDNQQYPAGDLLEVYLMRWGIEIAHPDYSSSDSLYRGSQAA
jgi:hypothetical protein